MIHKLMTIFLALFFKITFFVIIQYGRLSELVFMVLPPSPLYEHFRERPEPWLILPYFFTGFPPCGVGGVVGCSRAAMFVLGLASCGTFGPAGALRIGRTDDHLRYSTNRK